MAEVPKPMRRQNIDNAKLIRQMSCLVCGVKPSDAAHIKSRGAGGSDDLYNLASLCRVHHSIQHRMGWVQFALKYPEVFKYLQGLGWYIRENKLVRI